MFLSRLVLGGLALISVASAQSTNTRVAFTSVPAAVVGGETYNITWGGGDGSSVTITLRQGNPDSLGTVGILADGVEGYSYNWTVSRTLAPADDYALQITQGQDEINYSGQFALVESDNSTSTTSADSSATTSMSGNSTTATGIGGAGNSTMTSNSTMSTSSRPRTITTVPPTSANTEASNTAAVAAETGAPDSTDAAVKVTSSVALIIGIVGAMMLLS